MKKPNEPSNFRTHIPEPRWQQIISVIIVVLLVAVWVAFVWSGH